MSTLGFDHETARRVALGIQCSECDTSFVRAHLTPVACSFCYPELPLAERATVLRAVHEEETREAFRQRAKKRKESKNA